jgi:hypothetical protein
MANLVPWIRALFIAALAAYLVGVLLQATLAGVALFVQPTMNFDVHRGMGYLVHLAGLGAFVLGLLSRPGRPLLWWIIAFGVVAFIQPLLPLARDDMPYVAALHPVLAIVAFAIGLRILTQTAGWLREIGRTA